MSEISRRETVKLFALAPVAAALGLTPREIERASEYVRAVRQQPAPQSARFFTDDEMRLVGVLADLIIPADDRSGSATDAGVPDFIDFMMTDRPSNQIPMRGGLQWLDSESRRRFQRGFVDASAQQQRAILDDIAWPERARPEFSHGVAFFNRFRDFVATGFWSSRMGVDDLRFMGNRAVPIWNGCPDDALQHLGVRYDDA